MAPPPSATSHGVYRTHVLDELDPDRPCAFAGIDVFAVLDQKRAFDVSHLPRQMASILNVAVDNPHRRAQCANPVELKRVGAGARHDRHRNPAAPSALGQRQPEVAGAGADGRPRTGLFGQPRHDRLGAAGLEASHRIGGLEFENDLAIQRLAKSRARVLGRVPEDGAIFGIAERILFKSNRVVCGVAR